MFAMGGRGAGRGTVTICSPGNEQVRDRALIEGQAGLRQHDGDDADPSLSALSASTSRFDLFGQP
jgi:hypothetical protein